MSVELTREQVYELTLRLQAQEIELERLQTVSRRWRDALNKIAADGVEDPVGVARDALNWHSSSTVYSPL